MVPYKLLMCVADARVYQREDGTRPFDERFALLRNARAAARITTTVLKLERGLRPDVKPVGEGLQEARIDYGPGYRIYFGIDGTSLIVLVLCGDKRTQDADIQLAQALWAEYRRRKGQPPPGPRTLLKPKEDNDATDT